MNSKERLMEIITNWNRVQAYQPNVKLLIIKQNVEQVIREMKL